MAGSQPASGASTVPIQGEGKGTTNTGFRLSRYNANRRRDDHKRTKKSKNKFLSFSYSSSTLLGPGLKDRPNKEMPSEPTVETSIESKSQRSRQQSLGSQDDNPYNGHAGSNGGGSVGDISTNHRKRSRQEVLASIRLSATKVRDKGPYVPTVDNEDQLSLLERAFFDDEQQDASQNVHSDVAVSESKASNANGDNDNNDDDAHVKNIKTAQSNPTTTSIDLSETESENGDDDEDDLLFSTFHAFGHRATSTQSKKTAGDTDHSTGKGKANSKNKKSKNLLQSDRETSSGTCHDARDVEEKTAAVHDGIVGKHENDCPFVPFDDECVFMKVSEGYSGTQRGTLDSAPLPPPNLHKPKRIRRENGTLTHQPVLRDDYRPDDNLEPQIDWLYLQSDMSTTTVKTICNQLEVEFGWTLDKAARVKVRGRLKALVNQTAVPTPIARPTETAAAVADIPKTKTTIVPASTSVDNRKEKHKPGATDIGTTAPSTRGPKTGLPQGEDLAFFEPPKDSLPPSSASCFNNKNSHSLSPHSRESVAQLKSSDNHVLPSCTKASNPTASTKTRKMPASSKYDFCQKDMDSVPMDPVDISNNTGDVEENDAQDNENNDQELILSVCDNTQNGKAKRQPRKRKHSPTVDTQTMEAKEENDTTAEPKTKSRGKRTKMEPTNPDNENATVEKDPIDCNWENAFAAAKPAPPPRQRKRTRATTCALCKTCPCQKSSVNHDNVTTFDPKSTFARSDAAVEKALIRRIQKLEKSAEHLAEQKEMVRRNLKKHRRDIWKREEEMTSFKYTNSGGVFPVGAVAPDGAGALDVNSWFLPDAKDFERQQADTKPIDYGLVRKAQRNAYENVPFYQPSLTQLGFSRGKDDVDNPTDLFNLDDAIDTNRECAGSTADTSCSRLDDDKEEAAGGDVEKEEENRHQDEIYVAGREHDDRISHFDWNGRCLEQERNMFDGCSSSIKDAIIDTNFRKDETDVKSQAAPYYFSSFDKMFQEEKLELDHVLDMVGDEHNTNDVNDYSADAHIQEASDDEVQLSMLTQGAHDAAQDMLSNIAEDTDKVASLDETAPKWKENIAFSFYQKDPDELCGALESVKQKRARMNGIKLQLLKAWERQDMALEVFEAALEASVVRAREKAKGTRKDGNGGFLARGSA